MRGLVACAALACSSACAIATSAHSNRSDRTIAFHESVAATVLHGKRLDLHIAASRQDALQFQDALSRHDYLLRLHILAGSGQRDGAQQREGPVQRSRRPQGADP